MLGWVIRGLSADRGRTALTVLALGAAIAVILIFEGFRTGLYGQLRSFPQQLGADLILGQAGVDNFVAARSVLPQRARRAALAVPGVEGAHALTLLPVIFERRGVATPIQVVAYVDLGAPNNIIEGRPIEEPREVVVDVSLARDHALAPGDVIEFLGFEFTVVGVSSGTAAMFTPAVFVRYVDLVELFMTGDGLTDLPVAPPLLSHMLLELADNADVAEVRADLERSYPPADAHTPEELGEADAAMGARLFGPVLGLLIGLSYVIGGLVVGLTLFGSVQARTRTFAVLGALGASPLRLGAAVLTEAFVVAALAAVVGLLAATGGAELIEAVRPGHSVEPLTQDALLRTGAAVAALAVLGSLLPLRRVAAIDPALVFKA